MSVLSDADETINGPRQYTYGPPRLAFTRIAHLWDGYLRSRGIGAGILPEDCVQMMALLKMARLMQDPDHRDSVEDMAGYVGLYARVRGLDA